MEHEAPSTHGVTGQALRTALQHLFDMDEADASEISVTLLDVFAGNDEVADDALDQDLRSMFYTLEAKKLLSFRREDYSIESGERRRAFYWRLRKDIIENTTYDTQTGMDGDVYAGLPSDAWARHSRAS